MARLTLSEIISDIRGHVGAHTYSYWKGIHLLKNRPVNFRVPWESENQSVYRETISRLSRYWYNGLSSAQRTGWKMYAIYIATLGYPYYGDNVIKLVGWKQYGGIMSGFNAFVMTNQLRFSIGKTDILEDDPQSIDPPPQPVLGACEFVLGPPKLLRTTIERSDALVEDTWYRVFCRGHRYAHLILAAYGKATPDAPLSWDVEYDCVDKPLAATPPWSTYQYTGDYCTALGTEIVIDTTEAAAAAQCSYKLDVAGLDNTTGWTVEARLKTIEVLSGSFALIVFDGTSWFRVTFTEDQIEAFTGDTYSMDTTDDFHVYRITGSGSTMKVYVDGVLVITSTISGQATASKMVAFGDTSNIADWNSEAQWSYIKIYDNGEASPDTDTVEIQNMRYSQGAEFSLQNDVYDIQCDFISENGRYSPPSVIQTAAVHDSFPGGLWGSVYWDTLVWG